MLKTLTDMQRVLLAHAAAHDTGCVLPTPKTLTKNAGAIAVSLRALITSGLITEVPAVAGDVKWTHEEGSGPTTLIISDLGLRAIGVIPAQIDDRPSPHARVAVATLPRAGSKLAVVIGQLMQPQGATLDDLVLATGWQKHSVRGAISGALRTKLRLAISSDVIEGKGRVYRIVSGKEVAKESLIEQSTTLVAGASA